MGDKAFLEEMRILMKLVEDALQVVGVEETDEEERKAIEERVWKVVKKFRGRYIPYAYLPPS